LYHLPFERFRVQRGMTAEGSNGDAMSGASQPRRHHLLPRFYLLRFANETSQVALVDRVTGERRVTHIDNVTVERDYYAFETTDGSISFELEKLLGQLEGDGAAALRRVVSGFVDPSPSDRSAVAALIAFQAVRGRKTKRFYELLGDSLAKFQLAQLTDQEIQDRLVAGGKPATADDVKAMAAWVRDPTKYDVVPSPEGYIQQLINIAAELFVVLRGMAIHVVSFELPSLLTSDNPIAPYAKNPDPLRGVGIATADEIWFPVDRRHLILLTPHLEIPESVRPGSAAFAAGVNFSVATEAYEWIVMHPDDDHLGSLQGFELGPRPLAEMVSSADLAGFEQLGKPPKRRSPYRRKHPRNR
jgi:hypothetical protein